MSIQTTPEADRAAGVVPTAPWRLKALSVLPDYRLAVTFQDGTNGIVDFSAVLTAGECGIFEALKDKAWFDQARLELGVVTWPNGADIDPAWMYEEIRANKPKNRSYPEEQIPWQPSKRIDGGPIPARTRLR